LTVVELDVSGAPDPAPIGSRRWVPWLAAAAAGVLIAAGAGFLLRSPQTPRPAENAGDIEGTPPAVVAPPLVAAPTNKAPADGAPPAGGPVARPAEQPAVAEEDREVAVGSYVVLPEWGPSVLLERRGEGYPQARLRPEARLMTSHTLLCLPGYRAHLQLDSGVQLTLWGNVPEFCTVPPLLLESAVALKAADSADVDLDLVLVRGRIHLANTKKSGPARIRLRFLRDTWEITLADGSSEVAAELWGALLPPLEDGASATRPLTLGLFTKGTVALKPAPGAPIVDLPDRTRLSKVNEPNASLHRSVMAEPPDWWSQPPDIKQARIADVMLSLKDWEERLRQPGDLMNEIFRGCESRQPNRPRDQKVDPTFRSIGAYFLGAFDGEGIPLVVRLLEDPDHAEVRRGAAHSLRAWLARDPRHEDSLKKILRARIEPQQSAAEVWRLLYPFPEDTVTKREKWSRQSQDLLILMGDGNIALRDLAAWHLRELAREAGVSDLPAFDPGAPEDSRRQVVAAWKRMLAASQGRLR
jgi:hypothetical protein